MATKEITDIELPNLDVLGKKVEAEQQKSQEDEIYLTYENVGEYLNSQRFAAILAKANFNEANFISISTELIETSLEYVDAFTSSHSATLADLEIMLNDVVNFFNNGGLLHYYDINEAFANKIIKDAGMEKIETEEDELKAKNIVIDKISRNPRSYFHVFNGAYLDSIKEYGIDGNHKGTNDEHMRINEIMHKYDPNDRSAGGADIAGDRGKISVARGAAGLNDYKSMAPSWFAYWCGKEFFQARNYEAARNHVINQHTDRLKMTPEDKKELLDLFDKCWKSLANNKAIMAVIPREYTQDQIECLKETSDIIHVSDNYIKVLKAEHGYGRFDLTYGVDKVEHLDTTNASYIELPYERDLLKRIEIERQKTQGATV